MDITHLYQQLAVVETVRQRAEQTETPRGSDHVWAHPPAVVYESIAAVTRHLAVVAVGYPHAEGLARQQVSRLAQAVNRLYTQLTEPPVCAAEFPVGTDVANECEARPGHSGDHTTDHAQRALLDATARLLSDVQSINDHVRGGIFDTPSGAPAADHPDRQTLRETINRASRGLRTIAVELSLPTHPSHGSASLEHRPPAPPWNIGLQR